VVTIWSSLYQIPRNRWYFTMFGFTMNVFFQHALWWLRYIIVICVISILSDLVCAVVFYFFPEFLIHRKCCGISLLQLKKDQLINKQFSVTVGSLKMSITHSLNWVWTLLFTSVEKCYIWSYLLCWWIERVINRSKE
jgi:hypothetical protein